MNRPGLVAADGVTPLATQRPRAEAGPRQPYRGAGFDGADTVLWHAPYVSADAAALVGRETASARTRDLDRNNRYVRAIYSRMVDMIVGAGLKLSANPNPRALNLDQDQSRELVRQIETEWQLFAEDPLYRADARRRVTLNGQLRVLARTFVSMNEAAAVLKWKPEGGHYGTCVQVVDPDRISNPAGHPDTEALRGGIEYDEDGAVVAAHVRNAHPSDFWLGASLAAMTWERVPFRDARGRPVMIHAFEPDREDQSRGVTSLASALPALQQLGRLSDAEVATAILNATFAAFVKSNSTSAQVAEMLTPEASLQLEDYRIGYYEKAPVTINGIRIPVMPLGDEIQLNGQPRDTGSFVEFEAALVQQIAAAAGISYEQATSNWSRTNYSSARASLVETWRTVNRIVAQFTEQAVWPIYLAFLDEAIETGRIDVPAGAPGLFEAPAAWLRARWLGPPRGYIDPVKEAQAAQIRIATMVSTLERECAEQGLDVEDVLDQLAWEQAEIAGRGLSPPDTAGVLAVRAPTDEPGRPADERRE